MHERTNIQLNAVDRSAWLTATARKKQIWRAKIVFMTADGYGTAEIMRTPARPRR
jgi:hypothetical protein